MDWKKLLSNHRIRRSGTTDVRNEFDNQKWLFALAHCWPEHSGTFSDRNLVFLVLPMFSSPIA